MQRVTKKFFIVLAALVLAVISVGVFIFLSPSTTPESIPENEDTSPITLNDGERVEWLGTFHDSVSLGGLKSYTSNELGISLSYPEEYLLFHNVVSEMGIYEHFQHISIGPRDVVLETIARARVGLFGEIPYMIHLSFFYDPQLKVANINPEEYLKRWLVERQAQSNFYPDGQGEGTERVTLTPTTIDGVSAFRYHNAYGLNETDMVAFIHNDRIVIVSAPRDERMTKDFETVLSTLKLEKGTETE